MKFEIGQIVSYTASSVENAGLKWLFFITDVLPHKGAGGHYYRAFCLETPENLNSCKDLHQTIQISEASINAV